jgi:hypothetical protein
MHLLAKSFAAPGLFLGLSPSAGLLGSGSSPFPICDRRMISSVSPELPGLAAQTQWSLCSDVLHTTGQNGLLHIEVRCT